MHPPHTHTYAHTMVKGQKRRGGGWDNIQDMRRADWLPRDSHILTIHWGELHAPLISFRNKRSVSCCGLEHNRVVVGKVCMGGASTEAKECVQM